MALFLSASALAADKKIDYKCYLDTTQGKKIALFSWKSSKIKSRLVNLPASKVTVDGGRKVYVTDVLECIPENKGFKDLKAQELDSLILR